MRAVRAGHFYILVNSQKAPNGNLIGWLLPPHPFTGEAVPVAGHGFLPQLDVSPEMKKLLAASAVAAAVLGVNALAQNLATADLSPPNRPLPDAASLCRQLRRLPSRRSQWGG